MLHALPCLRCHNNNNSNCSNSPDVCSGLGRAAEYCCGLLKCEACALMCSLAIDISTYLHIYVPRQVSATHLKVTVDSRAAACNTDPSEVNVTRQWWWLIHGHNIHIHGGLPLVWYPIYPFVFFHTLRKINEKIKGRRSKKVSVPTKHQTQK